jgi:hypothetical protein
VDMSGALDPLEFVRLVAAGLDLPVPDRLGAARLALAAAIRAEAADGRSWLLAIENAQDASDDVWSEIKALAHAMELSEGPGAIVLVGPTELAGRLSSRRFTAIAARIEAHVHLLPLDVEEAGELLLGWVDLGNPELELLHRDAAGNPRRLLQLATRKVRPVRSVSVSGPRPAPPSMTEIPGSGELAPSPTGRIQDHRAVAVSISGRSEPSASDESPLPAASASMTPLVPSRPPLRVEDGLIEVGWEGSLEPELASPAEEASEPVSRLKVETPVPPGELADATSCLPPLPIEKELPSEEMIEDHYAALQAWTEWAKNRGRGETDQAGAARKARPAGTDRSDDAAAPQEDPAAALVAGRIWAEGQHDHAPYSQLFTRLRQSR